MSEAEEEEIEQNANNQENIQYENPPMEDAQTDIDNSDE
jgi:hypothetical protein